MALSQLTQYKEICKMDFFFFFSKGLSIFEIEGVKESDKSCEGLQPAFAEAEKIFREG